MLPGMPPTLRGQTKTLSERTLMPGMKLTISQEAYLKAIAEAEVEEGAAIAATIV